MAPHYKDEEIFFQLGLEIVNAKKKTLPQNYCLFASHFQAMPKVCSILWNRCYQFIQGHQTLKEAPFMVASFHESLLSI